MEIQMKLNGKPVSGHVADDTSLLTFVRDQGCLSVKCGCETSCCGLCTVFLDDVPVLSCSVPDQGADQCGFCNPGTVMNAIALFRENPDPTEEEVREYLAGNLCRCSGYEGQLRGIMRFLEWRKSQ